MRLIRYGPSDDENPGVEVNGHRYDCSAFFDDWNRQFFLDEGLEELQKVIKKGNLHKIDRDCRWASPIARPGMIMCVGLNYSDHAAESNMDLPDQPVLFMKATNTMSGPYDGVCIPRGSHHTDWEVELGVVLKKDALYLDSEQDAQNSIAGYCVVHDLSERAFQLERGGQWVKGKSCPGFTPTGPYLVTADEITAVNDLSIWLDVNDQRRQNSSTSRMIFKIPQIIHYISQYMSVEAGDLISTGTPAGVGLGFKPPLYIKPGDVVHLGIDQLGSQSQVFKLYQGKT